MERERGRERGKKVRERERERERERGKKERGTDVYSALRVICMYVCMCVCVYACAGAPGWGAGAGEEECDLAACFRRNSGGSGEMTAPSSVSAGGYGYASSTPGPTCTAAGSDKYDYDYAGATGVGAMKSGRTDRFADAGAALSSGGLGSSAWLEESSSIAAVVAAGRGGVLEPGLKRARGGCGGAATSSSPVNLSEIFGAAEDSEMTYNDSSSGQYNSVSVRSSLDSCIMPPPPPSSELPSELAGATSVGGGAGHSAAKTKRGRAAATPAAAVAATATATTHSPSSMGGNGAGAVSYANATGLFMSAAGAAGNVERGMHSMGPGTAEGLHDRQEAKHALSSPCSSKSFVFHHPFTSEIGDAEPGSTSGVTEACVGMDAPTHLYSQQFKHALQDTSTAAYPPIAEDLFEMRSRDVWQGNGGGDGRERGGGGHSSVSGFGFDAQVTNNTNTTYVRTVGGGSITIRRRR